jgi:hypothetical protein
MFRRRRIPEIRMPTSRRVGERLPRPQDPVALGATGSCHVRGRRRDARYDGLVRTLGRIPAGRVLIAVVVLTACGQTTAPPLTASPAASPTSSLVPPLGGTTGTDWGRIWDTLPAGFPMYPGATDSDETAAGPASATLVVQGNVAKAVATSMEGQLTAAGYAVDGTTNALEDGSYVLEATRDPGCRAQVTITPLGDLTQIKVLYGAGCPAP